MEKGYLKSSHPMLWGKDKELGPDKEDIRLVRYSVKMMLKGMFWGHALDSYRCEECKKIIISTDE